jgi:hypothetical protein
MGAVFACHELAENSRGQSSRLRNSVGWLKDSRRGRYNRIGATVDQYAVDKRGRELKERLLKKREGENENGEPDRQDES